jgi:hypothetical protein
MNLHHPPANMNHPHAPWRQWMRAVDASRRTTEHNLKQGKHIIVYPG